MSSDNLDQIKRESQPSYEGTKTAMGITGMIVLTLTLMVLLGLIAIWLL